MLLSKNYGCELVNNFIQLSLKPKFIFVDLCVVEAFVIGNFNHEIVF